MILALLSPEAEACACCDAELVVQREVLGQDAEANQLVRQTQSFCGGLRYALEVWPLDATGPSTCLDVRGRDLACDAPTSLRATDEVPAAAAERFPLASPIGVKDAVAKDHAKHALYDTQIPEWDRCRPTLGSGEPVGVGPEGLLIERMAWSCEQTWRRYEVHTATFESSCITAGGEPTACATAWSLDEADLGERFPTPLYPVYAGATFTTWEGGGWRVTDRLGTLIVEADGTD